MLSLRALLREPLLHFLLLGGALFALYQFVSGGQGPDQPDIVVSTARVNALAANFSRTWVRPPTAEELRGLIDDYIADEVYYREALALGIDRDDIVIRRRLRQKMEFISDGAGEVEPTDQQLQAFLEEYAQSFAEPARLRLQQVFVSAARGEGAGAEAQRLLALLNAPDSRVDPGELGDPTLLPARLTDVSAREVARTFGEAFVAPLEEAPVGTWVGPIRSGYGLHLVRIEGREPGRLPALAEIRPAVVREWQAVQSAEAKEAFLAQLRAKYRIRVEAPSAADDPRP